jgi:hypothetical protein
VTALASVGELDRAETLALSTDDRLTQLQALVAVAEAAVRVDQLDRADALADHAEAVAGSIKDANLLVQALDVIAPVMIRVGAADGLRRLADKAEAATRSLGEEM